MNGLVVIGGSSGGIKAVKKILSGLKPDFSFPMVIVLHLKADLHRNPLIDVFNHFSSLPVFEAGINQLLESGKVYVAPSDYHLQIEEDGIFSLSIEPRENYSRPSIDIFFESVSYLSTRPLYGILLTGANRDGAKGLKEIEAHGGTVIIQDPEEADMSIMPLAGMEETQNPIVLSLEDIIVFLNKQGVICDN